MSTWYPYVNDGLRYPAPYLVSDYIVREAGLLSTARFKLMVSGPTLTYRSGALEEYYSAIGCWDR